MAGHNAKSLFDKNIQSAKDCLTLYDSIAKLKPAGVNPKWLLRASIVFIVSAIDTYFHDRIKYRVGHFTESNLPKALGKFEIPLSELAQWKKAKRKGNVVRNWVLCRMSTQALQSPTAISEALKLIDINDFWNTLEPTNSKRTDLFSTFNALMKRRHQIAHEGDRLTSRRSGKSLREINRSYVVKSLTFSNNFIASVELNFPS